MTEMRSDVVEFVGPAKLVSSTTERAATAKSATGRRRWVQPVAALLALSVSGASVGWSTFASAAGATAPAKAKGDMKAVKAHFTKGKALFEKKDYAKAKDEFAAAENIFPGGPAEFYLGRCSEELGDYAGAVSWYNKALADPKLKQADEARDRVGKLNTRPVKLKVTSGAVSGGFISVDGVAVPDHTPASLDIAPGSHRILVQSAGMQDGTADVTLLPFTDGSVDITLVPVPAPVAVVPVALVPVDTTPVTVTPVTPPPSTASTSSDHSWVYVTGALAVAGLGFGTVFGIEALSEKSKFNSTPTTSIRDSGTRDALLADIGFGVGIALAVTTVVLIASDGPADDAVAAPPPSSMTPPPAPTGLPSTAPTGRRATPPSFVLLPFVSPVTVTGRSGGSAGAFATLRF